MKSIAIDGPSGAGKSTMARELAKKLSYVYVDTGALYRAIGYYVLSKKIDAQDEAAVITVLDEISIELAYDKGEQQVLLEGNDVSGEIRTPEVSMAASAVSAHPAVRAFLLSLQRKIAAVNNVVMDGRDIGTVVLPSADLKIFLTASPEDRAGRRYEELLEKGINAHYQEVLMDMKTRDYNDSHRKTAPLIPAEDAIIVDTTGNELQVSIDLLLNLVKEKFFT
jgi:cytidylate kinase